MATFYWQLLHHFSSTFGSTWKLEASVASWKLRQSNLFFSYSIEFDNLIHFTVPCSMVWPTPNFQLLPKSPSKHVGKCALFLSHADGWRNPPPGLGIYRRSSLAGRPDHLLYGLLLWRAQRSHPRGYSVHADFGHTFWVHCFVCSWTFGVVVKNLV